MNSPLTGVRLLSFEQYGAGPYGTQHLSDLGAEVIKIEPAGTDGDYARRLGPYYTDDNNGERAHDQNDNQNDNQSDKRSDGQNNEHATDSSVFFQSFNRNKKSLTLDITCDEGRRVFHQLVAKADGVCNNLRGDVPQKIGITYDHLKSANPAIVCAHCSAYGRRGPRKSWPGFDYLMQAEAGYFHLCGEPESPPARFGLSIVDYMAGQNMAIGLLSGIMAAKASGTGRDIDVNLFDTALTNLSYVANWALNSDYQPARVERSAHPTMVPCQLYKTADGWIYLMLNKASFWSLFCELIGQPELTGDPRFCDYDARLQHRSELTDLLDKALSENTTDHWLTQFGGSIPSAPVLTPQQALANPFLQQRDSVQQLRDSQDNAVNLLAPGIDAGVDRSNDTASPTLGQHTDEILLSIGYGRGDIDGLRGRGVI